MAFTFDSLDEVPEPMRVLFQEDESGKFTYDPASSEAGLKTALQRERENLKKVRERLKAFEGIEDPEAAREALARLEEIGSQPGPEEHEQRYKAREAQLTEKHQREIAKLQAERDRAASEMERYLLRAAEREAIADSGFEVNPGLELHVRDVLRVIREEDGTPHVRVIDPDTGDPRITAEPGKSGYMRPAELVKELHGNERFGHYFKGTKASGAGVKGSDGRPNGRVNPFSAKTRNLTEQMRLLQEQPEVAARLQAEAAAG